MRTVITHPNSPLPPEREATYLQNARQAFAEATAPIVEPVVAELGRLVIREAESALKLNPETAGPRFSDNLAEAAGRYDVMATPQPIDQAASNVANVNAESPSDMTDFVKALKERRRPTLQQQMWSKARERVQDPRFDDQ